MRLKQRGTSNDITELGKKGIKPMIFTIRRVLHSATRAISVCALALSLAGFIKAATGITGVVTDGSQPVRRARVSAVQVLNPLPGALNPTTLAQAADDGTFLFTDLAPGSYRVCAEALQVDLLNPCDWSSSPVAVEVIDGGQPASATVTLDKGAWVEINIDDPDRKYRDNEQPGIGATLIVGVWTPSGVFLPAQDLKEDKKGRTYRLLVPFDTDLKLLVRGQQVQLENDKGKKIRHTGDTTTFRVERKNNDKTQTAVFRYIVTDVTAVDTDALSDPDITADSAPAAAQPSSDAPTTNTGPNPPDAALPPLPPKPMQP
jgi:hypothetical protein